MENKLPRMRTLDECAVMLRELDPGAGLRWRPRRSRSIDRCGSGDPLPAGQIKPEKPHCKAVF